METEVLSQIPKQAEGGSHDTASEIEFDSFEVAAKKYDVLKKRFFHVNRWKFYCGGKFAEFNLFNKEGLLIDRNPEKGDYIRINLTGGKKKKTEQYDWVRIIYLNSVEKNQSAYVIINCQPCKSPQKEYSKFLPHFYSEKSTSSFIIQLINKRLVTSIHGRNELPNLNASIVDRIKNFVLSIGGLLGVSKIQWKSLSDGLLDFN